jgi:MFS transporter, DHA1 family, inner membrane transport protein
MTGRNRTLNLLALVSFASSLFMRATDPAIPQIAAGLGVEAATAALLTTAYALPYAFIQPLLGALADVFNKARLMLLCLLLVSAATFVCGFALRFDILVAARVFAGIACGGVVPIAFAMVGDEIPFAERQVAMGRLLFAIMTGNLLGSTCAGIVSDLIGWRGIFFVNAGFGTLVLILGVIGFRSAKTLRGRIDMSSMLENYGSVLQNPLAKICFGTVFLEALFMYGCFPYVATMLHQSGETRASIAGIVIAGFGIGGALYSLSVSRLLKALGERKLMQTGGMVMGFCLCVIALRAFWPMQFVNFGLLGFGFYMLHGVVQIYASELSPKARGSAMALHSFFFFLGQAVGPIVYGIGLNSIGLEPVLVFGALVLAVVGFTCAQWLRRNPEGSTA